MDELDRLRSALGDRYRVEDEIGHGGMATVYLAQDLKHERRVAIKVLRPDLASMLGPERFLREIQIEAGLQHINILPIYDSGEADGFLYYVMPYVEGESLRARIEREKQLPLDDALQITREIAEALSYAHDHGIVHRDIKPENILLSGGHAVLADFGIARAIGVAGGQRVTESGHAVGTPHYMSPEQAGGEAELDGRSDLYSLGCVLYEMLAGEPPFTGRTARAVIARHMAESPPPLLVVRPSVPPRVGEAIEKALAKTPADRFATAADFVTTLEIPAEPGAYPETPQPQLLSFLGELRKRMVLHVGLAYLAVAWLAIEFSGRLVERGILERWSAPVLLVGLAIGSPIILGLAWTQEAATTSIPTTQKRPSWRRWAERTRPGHLLTFLGALAIALLAGERVVANGPSTDEPPPDPLRIAVLPFEDQSQPQEFGHLALVFPEYLIDQLSRIGALTVLPYAAVKRFSPEDDFVDSVRDELNTGTFIEGTIFGHEEE
ncbi:MAG: protein kinase, partial [Gemmatimonadetes bacterium]|nr:protein kinase [Gemmatimonadota bacterium]